MFLFLCHYIKQLLCTFLEKYLSLQKVFTFVSYKAMLCKHCNPSANIIYSLHYIHLYLKYSCKITDIMLKKSTSYVFINTFLRFRLNLKKKVKIVSRGEFSFFFFLRKIFIICELFIFAFIRVEILKRGGLNLKKQN